MFASATLASLYFIVLPVIWLGTLGPEALAKELALELGPTFAPVLGGAAKAAAIWFMVFNMLHGTIAPLAAPHVLWRSYPKTDCCPNPSQNALAQTPLGSPR